MSDPLRLPHAAKHAAKTAAKRVAGGREPRRLAEPEGRRGLSAGPGGPRALPPGR